MEFIVPLFILTIGVVAYSNLKISRETKFLDYLAKIEKTKNIEFGQQWILTGSVDNAVEIDYIKTRSNFDKSFFWDYDFRKMIVIVKKK